MIGTVIDQFEIKSSLGEGGMGSVYLAKHVSISKSAAIKILKPEYIRNIEIVSRFKDEAETMTKFNHENIVRIYNYGENDHGPYVIMEYFTGTPLDEYLTQKVGLLSEERAIPIMKQILKAYDYVHKKGIVHRDIKPSNLLYDDENELVKVLDFGIAKDLTKTSSMTKTGTQMGTVFYMSPEQVQGKPVDTRSDIYSLGVTFYQLLTGVNPYSQFSTDYEVYSSIVRDDLPDPRSHYPGISERMVQILMKALAKNPDDRFQTCNELIEFIENSSLKIDVGDTGVLMGNVIIDPDPEKYNILQIGLMSVSALLSIIPSGVIGEMNMFYVNIIGLIGLVVTLILTKKNASFTLKPVLISALVIGSCVTLFSFSSMDQDGDGQHDFFDPCPTGYQVENC
jgi:serine/threonine protein kinase